MIRPDSTVPIKLANRYRRIASPRRREDRENCVFVFLIFFFQKFMARGSREVNKGLVMWSERWRHLALDFDGSRV